MGESGPSCSRRRWKSICLFTALICLGLTGCDLGIVAGPDTPRSSARKYLETQNAPLNLIHRMTNLSPLTPEEYKKYASCENAAVRHLLAKNPNVPSDLLAKLTMDPSDYVRRGAAQNSQLTPDQIRLLRYDKSEYTRARLVGNPIVPESMILEIYAENKRKFRHKISLASFAANPYCPESIRQDILQSDDPHAQEQSLRWKPIKTSGSK